MDAAEYEARLEMCRRELASRLGTSEVPDEVWGYVMKLGFPYDAITGGGKASWEVLVKEAKERLMELRKDLGVAVAPPGRDWRGTYEEVPINLSELTQRRSEAFSEASAALATLHPLVREFREHYLGGPEKTVSAAEAEKILEQWDSAPREERAATREKRRFGFLFMRDSPSEKLRRVIDELCRQYGWQEGDARQFVLTGHVPTINPVRATLPGPRSRLRTEGHEYALETLQITLTAHIWVRAEDIERVFRDIQRQVLGGDNRPTSERVLSVVRFVARQMMERGREPWSKRWERWQQHAPQRWHYKSYREFRQAFLRFTRPKYNSPNVKNAQTDESDLASTFRRVGERRKPDG